MVELVYEGMIGVVADSIGSSGKKYYSLILTLFV